MEPSVERVTPHLGDRDRSVLHERHEPGDHPYDGDRSRSDGAREEFVEALHDRSSLRSTTVTGPPRFPQTVTSASSYLVDASAGVFAATQSSASPKSSSWLSTPASAC